MSKKYSAMTEGTQWYVDDLILAAVSDHLFRQSRQLSTSVGMEVSQHMIKNGGVKCYVCTLCYC